MGKVRADASRLLRPFACLVFCAAPAMASESPSPWAVGGCGDAVRIEQARGAAAIRGAERGAADWVPHPFSEKPDEIADNFLVRHRMAYSDLTVRQMPAEEAELFRLADAGRLGWEVTRVVDWTLVRCSPAQPRESFWLLRVVEMPRRREIARVTVAASGLVNMVRFNGPETRPLGPLLPLEPRGAEAFAPDPASAQYVAPWTSLQCAAIDPCVAWRTPKGVLVQARDALVLVPSDETPLRLDVELTRGSGSEAWAAVRQRGDHIVSRGGNLAGVGRVVGPGIPWTP
jgi:hypothetical protein